MGMTLVDERPQAGVIADGHGASAPLDSPEGRRIIADRVGEAAGRPRDARGRLMIPTEEEFGDREFLEAPGLEQLAERLIGETDTFWHLRDARIRYLWKAEGGKSKGRRKLGACVKPSGLVLYFGNGADFCVWIACDHARELGFGPHEIEACLAHELMHAGWKEPKNEDAEGAFVVVGHDFEGFVKEIELYGTWSADLQDASKAIRQLPLPGTADGRRPGR